MSASKLDGFSERNESEKNKPVESKGAARALILAEKELAKERLRATQAEASSSSSLPSPAERRKILERAGSLIAQARSLLDRLDGAELEGSPRLHTNLPKGRQSNPADS